jgi:Anaphase-promoting complex subunit 4 WD40 domain
MERSFLTKEEYGAVHEEPFPEGSELSKEEVEAKWSDRYMRLKLSSARQLSEMAEQVAVLTAKVAYLEMLCDRHGIAPGDEDSSSLEAGLALLTGGVMPPVRRDEVQANAAVALTLPSGPAATLSGLHSGQNVISVAIAGRLVELEEMPVLLLSGGADKRVVASQFDTASHSVTISGAVALPAPVLDISVRPNLTDSDVDGVLAAVALMDGSVALISAAVDLAAPIPVTARPPVNVAVQCLQKDHTKFVTRVKWSSSGAMLATACQDGGVSIYAVEVGAALRKLTTITFPGTNDQRFCIHSQCVCAPFMRRCLCFVFRRRGSCGVCFHSCGPAPRWRIRSCKRSWSSCSLLHQCRVIARECSRFRTAILLTLFCCVRVGAAGRFP